MHAKQKLQQPRSQRACLTKHSYLNTVQMSADAVIPVITTVQFTDFMQSFLVANAASHHDAGRTLDYRCRMQKGGDPVTYHSS